VANRNLPEIELAGFKVGPLQEGVEYEFRFWIAQELAKAGIVRFHEEDVLDAVKLNKIHWKERVQTVKQISPLPEDFYPQLRRCIKDTKKKANSTPEKMAEYDKIIGLSRDIVNCRLKKIISLASAPAQTDQFLKSLTKEERALYNCLYEMITGWRNEILRGDNGKNE
jgi:DNA replication initiation complex subunit (GINS family)